MIKMQTTVMLWGPFSPRLTSARWVYYLQLFIKKTDAGISLVIQWLRTCAFNVGEVLLLVGELRSHMLHNMAKKKKKKFILSRFCNVLKVTMITSNEVKMENRSFWLQIPYLQCPVTYLLNNERRKWHFHAPKMKVRTAWKSKKIGHWKMNSPGQ